ncbi:MAG TPA: hypothetical protein VHY83_11840 [Solirubrobacteraceae bacterium]|nr:hypothetical protein [Solirubrobacteraceae bacterium]
MSTQLAIALVRSRTIRRWLAAAAALALLTPVLVAACVTALLAEEQRSACGSGGETLGEPAAGGAIGAGLYAAPLTLAPGRAYLVGATEYGGPDDPSSGNYGSIPNPAEAYLPGHPDSFAELSVLDTNPANHGGFSFADANALAALPYLTKLRVSHDGHRALLAKRDIGYGQGPTQHIENGQPYRIDVWWQAARQLGIAKGPVRIALAPPGGAAGTLEQLPGETASASESPGECPTLPGASEIPLPLVPGASTRILPSGLAAAGAEAPAAVKAMVAAGNRLHTAAYLYGGGHGTSLDTLQPAYDCSSAVSYLLHSAGALGASALDSSELARYGAPGPGRYITIYANAAHTFIYVAGLRLDTVEAPAYDTGPNSGRPGPRWRISQSVPAWAAWTVRHPPGL